MLHLEDGYLDPEPFSDSISVLGFLRLLLLHLLRLHLAHPVFIQKRTNYSFSHSRFVMLASANASTLVECILFQFVIITLIADTRPSGRNFDSNKLTRFPCIS